jgi:hypothetical protein
MDRLKLSLQGLAAGTEMTISLGDMQSRFTDAAKQVVSPLDDKSINRWLAANGFTDSRVAERAADVLTAVRELIDGQAGGFSPADPFNQRVTAHPATPPFTVYRPTRFTPLIPWAIGGATWLIGAGVVVLVGRRVQSRRDADQT